MNREFSFPLVREILAPRPVPPAPPDKLRLRDSQPRMVAASLVACPPRKS
jgi:hypothetical protein